MIFHSYVKLAKGKSREISLDLMASHELIFSISPVLLRAQGKVPELGKAKDMLNEFEAEKTPQQNWWNQFSANIWTYVQIFYPDAPCLV